MRRLVYLAALAAAAPDTDTQLKRAAALARWVDRTGPAPPSWTVAGPKDVTVGQEVHAGKIKKVSRATVELGGSSAVVKTIEQKEGGGTLLMELLFLHALRGAPGIPDLYGAWFEDDRVTYDVGDGVLRARGPRRARGAREVRRGHVCAPFRKNTCMGRCSSTVAAPLHRGPRDGWRPRIFTRLDPPRVGRGSRRPAVLRGARGGDRPTRRWRNRELIASGL